MLQLVAVLTLLAGCDAVFRIHEVDPIDAPPTAEDDEDGDLISNASDNCPGMFNPMQEHDGGEAVGSVCDPHPLRAGDALVAFASFSKGFSGWTPDDVARWSVADGAVTTVGAADATDAQLSLTATAVLRADPAMVELDPSMSSWTRAVRPACRFRVKSGGI